MGEIGTIFQNAILYVAGSEGLEKFGRAGYDIGTPKILLSDGSLDLPRLMNILLDVFPEEQASAITDNVLANYVERIGGEQKKAHVIVDGKKMDIMPAAEEPYENNLARYLATDAGDVRDIINEARRIRMAMGKPMQTGQPMQMGKPMQTGQPMQMGKPMQTGQPMQMGKPMPAHVENLPEEEKPVKPAASIGMEPQRPVISLVAPFTPVKKPAEPGPDMMEAEIKRFVTARKAYTSVDIMDFIRYLKDKGYHFQENIVLENVYTRLEERKSRERAALTADIMGFLERLPWPTESEVATFIEMKKREGIMCDGTEIKRMILVEMIRKN